MKKCAKATHVGETTAGGGLGVNIGYYYNDFSFAIPSYESKDTTNNMYSKVSGIKPDIEIKSDSAFIMAYRVAMINSGTLTEDKFIKGLGKCSGNYDNLILQDNFGQIKIYKKENELYIKSSFSSIEKLIKINENTYLWQNRIYVKFNSDKKNHKVPEFYFKDKKIE